MREILSNLPVGCKTVIPYDRYNRMLAKEIGRSLGLNITTHVRNNELHIYNDMLEEPEPKDLIVSTKFKVTDGIVVEENNYDKYTKSVSEFRREETTDHSTPEG